MSKTVKTTRDTHRKTGRRLTVASAIWASAFIGSSWLLTRELLSSALAQWLAIILPGLIGLIAILVFLQHLRALDELQRRMQLEALGVAFGVGVLYAICFQLYAVIHEVAGKDNHAAAVLLLAWIAGQLLAKWRYK